MVHSHSIPEATMKPALLVTLIFLCIVAFGHLLRVLLGIGLLVGRQSVPQWPSVVATVALFALAVWLYREQGAK
jgi:hypothetical protein